MCFYIIMTPVLLYSVWMIFSLRKMKQHDTVLFKFCDVRRSIMGVLRERGFDLTPEEYKVLRIMLEVLDSTIHRIGRRKPPLYSGKKCAFPP